jgi:hypothetical protein
MVFMTIIRTATQPTVGWVFALSVWWFIGICSAVSHTRWERQINGTVKSGNKVWIFYTWYALNGPVLFFCTKVTEAVQTHHHQNS